MNDQVDFNQAYDEYEAGVIHSDRFNDTAIEEFLSRCAAEHEQFLNSQNIESVRLFENVNPAQRSAD
jgi:hypothetical protein